jgi:hypothetical protein
MGTSMSVRRRREEIPEILKVGRGADVTIPPFWELEDLIARGFDHDTALQIMAMRRPEPCARTTWIISDPQATSDPQPSADEALADAPDWPAHH